MNLPTLILMAGLVMIFHMGVNLCVKLNITTLTLVALRVILGPYQKRTASTVNCLPSLTSRTSP